MREKICCTLTDIFEGFITVLTAPYLYNTSLICKERHGDIVFLHNIKNAVSDSYQVHLCEVIFWLERPQECVEGGCHIVTKTGQTKMVCGTQNVRATSRRLTRAVKR